MRIGHWLIDGDTNSLAGPDGREHLEPRVMDLLVYLADRPHSIVSRDEIVENVWRRAFASDQAITNAIAKLRKTLGDDATRPRILETIPRKGYRLIADVSRCTRPKRVIGPKLKAAAAVSLAVAIITSAVMIDGRSMARYPLTTRVLTTTLIGQEATPAFSRNGAKIAFANRPDATANWQIYVQPLDDHRPIAITDGHFNDRHPIWSPAGSTIAFHRLGKRHCSIMAIDISESGSASGEPFKLVDCHPSSIALSMAFSHQGDAIYFTDGVSSTSPYRLYRYDLMTSAKVQLTNPPAEGRGDYRIALAHDGQSIAYLRNRRWLTTEIRVFDLDRQRDVLRGEAPWISRDIAWGQQGEVLLSNPDGSLQALPPDGRPRAVTPLLSETSTPRLSDDASMLALVAGDALISNLWRVEMGGGAQPLAGTMADDYAPGFANSTGNVAFVSERSGLPQVWVINNDGDLKQLTRLERYATLAQLSWSPDDRWIVGSDRGRVFRLNAGGGELDYLTDASIAAAHPHWSADGESVFFASEAGGDWQIWRVDLAIRVASAITQTGGFGVVADRSRLIYSKYHRPGLWQSSLDGSDEHLILDAFDPVNAKTLQLVGDRIYFSSRFGRSVQYLDLDSRRVQTLLRRPATALTTFAVAPDERSIIYARNESLDSQIIAFR